MAKVKAGGKGKGRRLKVFQARFGFHDSVVAAPSQAAALRAWGVRQNLFADGDAAVADDPQAVAAALAHPETPLRRAAGSNRPFALDPVGLPEWPDEPRREARARPKTAGLGTPEPKSPKTKAAETKAAETKAAKNEAAWAPPPKPPPPDRSTLDRAEAALAALEAARKQEEAHFRRRQDDLDAERQAARQAYVDSRKRAAAAVSDARADYRARDRDPR